MYGHSNAVAGMKEPHQFKMVKYQFKLDEGCQNETISSVVLTHYKQWSCTEQWLSDLYPDKEEQHNVPTVKNRQQEGPLKKKRKITAGKLKKKGQKSNMS